MAQYRSQWTGEVIDTAVGNAKDLAFVEIGVDAAGALEKCKKAFGVSALYGIGDYDPLVYLSANLYHCISGGIFGGHEYWFAHLRGTRLRLYKLYEVNNVAYWDGPIITDYAEVDDVNARLRGADAAFNCRYDTSSYNIEAGQYVFWKTYLWIATKNIAVGDTLASTGANKNLERVSNGGLNELKSAIDYIANRTIVSDNPSATSVASGTVTKVASVVLSKGIWLTLIFADWAANANGIRRISIADSVTPGRTSAVTSVPVASSAEHYMNLPNFISVSADNYEFAEYAYQDSGSALNVWPRIEAIKIAEL